MAGSAADHQGRRALKVHRRLSQAMYNHVLVCAYYFFSVPLVISAIVNVAQDNDNAVEDWVLEVIGHDGVAVNLTVAPGEMIAYESHSVLHGRPYPLTGRYYANLFLHYEPVGYTQELMERLSSSSSSSSSTTTTTTTKPRRKKSNKELFQAALAKALGSVAGNVNEKGRFDDNHIDDNNQNTSKQRRIASGNNNKNEQQQQQPPSQPRVDDDVKSLDLPYYIAEDSKEASRWRQEFVFRRKVLPPKPPLPVMSFHQHVRIVTGNNNKNDTPHTLAARGKLDELIALSVKDASLMDLADRNGWKPIHEAARAGRAEIIQFLIDTHGVDVNERTNQGNGGSPLYWAEQSGDKETIKLLKSHGAKSYKPELD
jgi:hypothetical protein